MIQNFALLICFLFVNVSSWAITKLVEFPNPFCYLEDLYFLPTESAFVTVGDPSIIKKVIGISDKRGYSFRNQETSPADATLLQGTTLFIFEMDRTQCCSYHFFHILEHIIGDWVFYADEYSEDVKTIVLASSGEKKWRWGDAEVAWKGPNEINKQLLEALFPNARILTWVQFLDEFQEKPVCFERAVTSDRKLAETIHESGRLGRMLGYSRQFFSKEALQHMADKVHAYAQTDAAQPTETLRVTYLKRPPTRTLAPAVEIELLDKIRSLENVSLRVEDFAKISFKEQINIIGNTDVLISVHGNGLSHSLFLPPSAHVIEIFPPNTHTVDYRIYAEARGLDYTCIMSNQGIISRELSYRIGMYGNFAGTVDSLDISLVLRAIKKELLRGKSFRHSRTRFSRTSR